MNQPPLRIIFAGTPEFAAQHLAVLLESQHDVVAVYTQPDRPAGRGKKLTASPVKALAQSAGVAVYQPPSLKDDTQQKLLASLDADVMVVVAYGLILPQSVLDTPRLGCLNVHASLLPRWRGAAPIQRAIEAGDDHTGITIMQMDAGLDTGAMLANTRVEIGEGTTANSLHDELAQAGAPLLLKVLSSLPEHLNGARKQEETGATYASKITKDEALIHWQLDAGQLDKAIRAFNPFPVSYTTVGGQRLKIWQARPGPAAEPVAPGTILRADAEGIEVACGEGSLTLTQLQLPGGKAMPAAQLLNARSELFAPGVLLGES